MPSKTVVRIIENALEFMIKTDFSHGRGDKAVVSTNFVALLESR